SRADTAVDKVIVFSHKRPLGELLSEIATLFDYSWEVGRTAPGEPAHYELFAGLRAKSRDARLYQLSVGAVGARLQEFVNGLRLSDDAIARLPADDPLKRILTNANCRTGLEFYSLLSHDQKSQLLSAHKISVPYSALTRSQQAAADEVMSS